MATGERDPSTGEVLAEIQELVDALGITAMAMDDAVAGGGEPGPELVSDCFRAVHTFKGLAGVIGLANAGRMAHELETLLDCIRLGKVRCDQAVSELVLEAVERFAAAIAEAARGGDAPVTAADAFAHRVGEVLRAAPAPAPAPSARYDLLPELCAALTEYESHRLAVCAASGRPLLRAQVVLPLSDLDAGMARIQELGQGLGEVITSVPGDISDAGIVLTVLVATVASPAEVAAVLGDGADVKLVARLDDATPKTAATAEPEIQPIVATTIEPEIQPAPPAAMPSSLRSVAQTVRVDIRKLDALMTAVGELGLIHVGLAGAAAHLGDSEPARALRSDLRAFERKLGELSQGILEVRMVPLAQVFDKLARVVRKLSRSAQKKIRFDITGGDTELDKLIVEELSDPLMHIIRNAIDHGIEDAGERAAAGKSATGHIAVAAFSQGNRVLVQITDDGRGIDPGAVAASATRKGLVSPAQVRDLSRRELLGLLFLPGMSTREVVTELSGRGVGLDVVKTNIAKLGGIIDVASVLGTGTELTVTLPVTLAIIQAVVVRLRGRTFAIPVNSVLETLAIDAADIRHIGGRHIARVRNHSLRLVDAGELLGLGGADPGRDPVYVVVCGLAQHRIGFVVDELCEEQDIVVKSLGRLLAKVRGIAGATELYGRETVLVLDVPALIEDATGPRRAEVAA